MSYLFQNVFNLFQCRRPVFSDNWSWFRVMRQNLFKIKDVCAYAFYLGFVRFILRKIIFYGVNVTLKASVMIRPPEIVSNQMFVTAPFTCSYHYTFPIGEAWHSVTISLRSRLESQAIVRENRWWARKGRERERERTYCLTNGASILEFKLSASYKGSCWWRWFIIKHSLRGCTECRKLWDLGLVRMRFFGLMIVVVFGSHKIGTFWNRSVSIIFSWWHQEFKRRC